MSNHVEPHQTTSNHVKLRSLTRYLETLAPPAYQESYDNARLIVGDPNMDVTGVLCSLDCVESVLDEAKEKGCNVVVAHHPIVFRGLKSLTGRDYVERTVLKAIRENIAIYAIHTNLDAVQTGVNAKICDVLGLTDTRILAPKGNLMRLRVYCKKGDVSTLVQRLTAVGAGSVNAETGRVFATDGVGGADGETRKETRLEFLFPKPLTGALLREIPDIIRYELETTEVTDRTVGSGMVGRLAEPMSEANFLAHLKSRLGTGCIRHTELRGKPVETVAVCGGAGSFLFRKARAARADFFVTADYKYHEFFDADGQLVIADVGHFESEQFTRELLRDRISEEFSTFAARLSEVNTNPVRYYC